MLTSYKTLATSLSLLLMSGCAIIPGSHLEGIDAQASQSTLEQDLSNVNISIIDSQLIKQLKNDNEKNVTTKASTIDVSNYDYVLGIGDVLSIGVWDHPELTIPAAVQRTAAFDGFRVQADGTITYAYAAKIPAAGKTISQLHDTLVKKLSKIIEKPQVDIKVVGFNSQRAYVTGEVKKPGTYAITEIPLTLIDAINQAGGLNPKADWRTVTFTRGNNTEIIKLDDFYAKGDISQNRLLQHGDIIHINRTDNQKVFVLGDVNQAGSIEINRYGLSLAEALSDVGGLKEQTANANGVFVLRKREANNEGDVIADVYQLHAKNVVALVLADQFQLQPRDIVYVTTAPIARWNRLISQLVPTIQALDDISTLKSRGHIF
ncbi:polysaccharide export protein [Psychrobium sp. 1_MG-2023]|uniref:polysaccharide export protein n=1 Tax=Psychrobium sp. 1_MG-2023 TaxID=3062624 RepID=UPI000C349659|nr:polysaccharide export protein [Psychrobium sp. 1_MG-2023]MDP2562099.1 polysaccharide export protein [Psychrobium sp. 1_MG-2023]PKF55698.1 polysaccharide biosynthesis protein [Alteromonadales bacterium alter-6D02]